MKKIGILIIFFSLIFIGCGKEPNDVGFGLLPENEIFNVEIYEDSVEVYVENVKNFITNSSSEILWIGNYDSISCGILIHFDIPDTLGNVKMNWARLRLFEADTTVLGDSTISLRFTVHKILSNYDTLYDSRAIGEFNAIPDSVIYVEIDTSVVREWFLGKNHGLYLNPQSYGAIWGFNSFDAGLFIPALEVEITRTNEDVDTLRFLSGSDGYIANIKCDIDSNYIQVGVGLRGIVKFDISRLPKNIIVNRAELRLYLKEKKKYTQTPDSILVSFITNPDFVRKSIGGFEANYLGVKSQSDTLEYIIPITTPVQRWVNGEINNGVLVRYFLEYESFNRLTFYYTERKPKLKVYYTKKPGI